MLLAVQPSACSLTTADLRSPGSGVSWYGAKRLSILKGQASSERIRFTVCFDGLLPNLT